MYVNNELIGWKNTLPSYKNTVHEFDTYQPVELSHDTHEDDLVLMVKCLESFLIIIAMLEISPLFGENRMYTSLFELRDTHDDKSFKQSR